MLPYHPQVFFSLYFCPIIPNSLCFFTESMQKLWKSEIIFKLTNKKRRFFFCQLHFERARVFLKVTKVLLTLCLCAGLVFSCIPTVFAAESVSSLEDFIARYSTLFDSVLENFQSTAGESGLQITDELRQKLSECDPAALLADLKALSKDTAGLNDEELDALIAAAAEQHGVPLVDSQIRQLRNLLRLLEKLSENELREKLDALKSGTEQLRNHQEKLSGILGSAQRILEKISAAVQPALQWISQLFETIRAKT